MAPSAPIVCQAAGTSTDSCQTNGDDAHDLDAVPKDSGDLSCLAMCRSFGFGGSLRSCRLFVHRHIRSKHAGRAYPSPPHASRTISSLDVKTRESIVFRNSSLLRAIHTPNALHHFGALFKSSVGSAETYALSKPVHAIDVFISHNWCTPAREKFVALALYFNLRDALLAAALGASAAALLTALEVLPTLAYHPALDDDRASIASRVTGFAVLLLALFLGHEVKGRLGGSGLRLFVDKAVIHQTDVELQREGIRHLAAFLALSNRMVIVYTPEIYLKRLWTVYELASMIVLKPIHHIEFLPTRLPNLVLWTSTLWFFSSVTHTLLRTEALWGLLPLALTGKVGNILSTFVFLIPCCLVGFMLRRWAKRCQGMWKSVEHFSIQSTQCACEEDRPLVFGNIAAFMRDFSLIEPGASEAEALEAFNEFMRLQLPLALRAFYGHTAFSYKYAVVMMAPQLLKIFDDVGAGFLGGQVRVCCIWAAFDATVALAAAPSFGIAHQWATREAGFARYALKALVVLCLFFVSMALLQQLAYLSETSNSWLLAFLGMVTAWSALTAFLYQHDAVASRMSRSQISSFELRKKM